MNSSGIPGPSLPEPPRGVGFEWGVIEYAQPNADHQSGTFGLNCLDRLATKSRAIVQASAVFSRAGECAEHLVAQIPVTGFDIDELKTDALRQLCRTHEIVDQPRDFVVADDDRIIVQRDPEFGVEDRVMIGDFRLSFFLS